MHNDNPIETLISVKDKISFFQTLAPTEINQLIEDVKILTFMNKKVIFNEGPTDSQYMYYLLRGSINIVKNKAKSDPTKIQIQRVQEPALFGELHVLTGEPRNATVEAAEDNTLVLAFKIKEFEIKTPVSKFYKNVIVELGKKITAMNDKLYTAQVK